MLLIQSSLAEGEIVLLLVMTQGSWRTWSVHYDLEPNIFWPNLATESIKYTVFYLISSSL